MKNFLTISGALLIILLMNYSCKKDKPKPPTVITTDVTEISYTTAISGGAVINEGGATVVSRGVCWNTSTNPTILFTNNMTIDGSGLGTFISSITNLSPNTKYYLRAYAISSAGISYGVENTFTTKATVSDADGNIYHEILIGVQTWMVESLKTTKYRNGELIGTTSPFNKDISTESSPKYQWAYGGTESNVATFGRLYTWYAATDSRNVCPAGWHVPTDGEWTVLVNYLISNGYNYDGTTTGNKIAKALASNTLWTVYTVAGTVGNTDYPNKRNATGFTALPGGYRSINGTFNNLGNTGSWWSVTEADAITAWSRDLDYNYEDVYRSGTGKMEAESVRCIKD